MIQQGDKLLITTDNYFYAGDGNQYRGVFGTVQAVHAAKDVLGLEPNRNSSNWMVEIGSRTPVFIMGCRIHYAVKRDSLESTTVRSWESGVEHGLKTFELTDAIYNAD